MFGRLRDIFSFFKEPKNKSPPSEIDRSSSTENNTVINPTGENAIACDAITNKLTEVAEIAESLDSTFRDCQNGVDMLEANSSSLEKRCEHSQSSSLDDWNSSLKSTEDESFMTASDSNCTSQSVASSFQTPSECLTSPLWNFEKCSMDAEEDLEPSASASNGQAINGVLSAMNESVDSSENSFLSAQTSPPSHSVSSSKSDNTGSDEKMEKSENVSCWNGGAKAEEQVPAGDKLENADQIHIKIVEVEPKLTTLGANIDEAVCLQKEHDELLRQLEGMPTPVEEFVQKAEKLLASKKINVNTSDAMGQTLNIVWEDILKLVHDRKHLLDLCANFHEKMGSCQGKMAALEVACKDTMIPIEVEAVQDFLNKFKQLRIEVLTTVMSALKEGNELLAKLQEISQVGTLDSRPDHVKRDAMHSISELQQWLENLHDQRNMLEAAWQTRKTQLEQCLALAILAKDLTELENTLMNRKNDLSGIFSLGECERTAGLALQEYISLKREALLLRDRALKITRTTEKLVAAGSFAGNEACSRAYNVLSNCTDYLELLDQREHWLSQSKEFYAKAEKTLSVLEKLEVQLSTVKLPQNSSESFSMFSKVLDDLRAFTEEPLRLGYALLDEVGRTKPETTGIKRVLDEIENRKIYVEGMCSTSTEEHLRVTQALNDFLEQYNELLSWLVSIAEEFLKANNSIEDTLQKSKQFLHLHHKLMQDLEIKGESINKLLENIKQYLNSLDAQQRYDVDSRAESLHKHWIELKDLVLKRVDLVSLYIDFLEKAQKLSNMFNDFEATLLNNSDEQNMPELESAWSEIKVSYGNLKAVGMRFLNSKVADPYLETKSACSSVEDILNSFSNRQFNIKSSWEEWKTSVTEKREVEILLEKIMNEQVEALKQTVKIEAQLYPVFDLASENPKELKDHTNSKRGEIAKDIERAQDEIIQRKLAAANVQTKDKEMSGKVEQVINSLQSLKSKLDNIKFDYNSLVEDLLTFLDSIISIRTSIDQFFAEKQITAADSENLPKYISSHESFRECIMDKFRTLISQSEKLIDRVRSVEPQGAREHDTDRILKLMENLRIHFESNNDRRMAEMQDLQAISNFDKDLSEINTNLDNISAQLQTIRGQTAESSATAKTTSLAFEYFERTIELLEKRIENFVKSSENIYTTNRDKEPHIRGELDKLQERWKNIKDQVKTTRNKLNLGTEYFQLYTQVDSEYRKLSSFYSSVINKIPFLRSSVDASNLINDIKKFVDESETPLKEKVKKLQALSLEVYNEDKTSSFRTDVETLLQSFVKLKSDIEVVEERLKNEEKKPKEEEKAPKEPQSTVITEVQKETKITEVFSEVKYSSPRFTKPLKDAVTREGEKVTFECEVVGSPQPSVEWFKDGISIQSNPDYSTSYSNGVCTLSIEETFAADSAKFMCRASNIVGKDETSATLTVKEHLINQEMTEPKIIKYLENGTAKEGSTFQFSCVATGSPLPTVQWFKEDKCIDDSPDYVITYNNGEAILKFEKVYLEDKAMYTCKFTNPVGFEQCSAILHVEPLEPTEVPRFKEHLSNVMARVGQKIKLECVVTGIPRPELYWSHNGKPFSGRDVKYENERATLIIPEAYPKDGGVYILTARNLAGEAYSSCNVTVKGRLPNETSDSEIASDMEPIKPSVQLPLKDIAVFEGKSVRLDCVIVGQPEPEVIWYHNDRPVKESADVQLLFQGDRCTLIIQEAYLEDAGAYKVIAINSAGEASSSCTLTVTPLNLSASVITRSQGERVLTSEMQPKFEKFLTDVLANEGDTVELECTVLGHPTITAKWFLNNREFFESDRIKFVTENDKNFKLVIRNVCADDKGVYTVKVSNSYGDAKCFSHLIVKSVNVSSQRPQMEIEEKFISPTFKELFSDKNAIQGDTVKFECIVIGKPVPKIKWFFNDQPVQGKNFLVSTSGDRQVLTIPSANVDAVGKIACVAENEVGKATCVANLNLLGEGIQPSSVDVQSLTQEHNTESSRVTIKKQMFTTTSTSQLSTVQSGIPQIDVSDARSPTVKVLEHLVTQRPEIIGSHHYKEFHKTSDIPASIQQKSVVVVDKIQEAVQPKGTRKQAAPKFVSPLVGKIVDQGATVTLEAIYDGFPSPEIKVQKNGEDLFDRDHIKITNKCNKVSIDLSDVGVRDAGRYSITASNVAGTATSTADIVVKKTIFPPVFGRRLQAQVAKRGERVVMEVEVTGTPEPTVTWYKDNQPLKGLVPSEYRIKSEGSTHTLIIEKAQTKDSGKYMVKATNAGGEAQSIADFVVLEPTPERMVEVVKTVVYDDLKDFKPESFQPEPMSFQSTKTETSTESDIHGTSESKVVTEHRCTTEATMRMEHKPTFLDLPELKGKQSAPVPDLEQKSISTSTEKIKTMIGATQTPSHETVKPTEAEGSSSVESSSITKKSAFEFFKKIQVEPISAPIHEDKYTKFEDVNKKFKSTEKVVPVEKEEPLKETVPVDEDLIKLNLTPGTPPEIGYIPKPSTPQTEHISDRIKKLQQVQKVNSEIPPGGVPTLPPLIRTEEFSKSSFLRETKFDTIPNLVVKPQPILPIAPLKTERSTSPMPSKEGVTMEKLWASPKAFGHETISRDFVQQTQIQQSIPLIEQDLKYPLPEEPKGKSVKESKKIFEEKIHQEKVWEHQKTTSELKSPSLVKQTTYKPEPLKPSIPSIEEVQLVPGSPPEICFAPKPLEEETHTHVKTFEQTFEKKILSEPSKVLLCSVRAFPPSKKEETIAPPLPPKDFQITAPPVPVRPSQPIEKPFTPSVFKPITSLGTKIKPPPPAIPSKFMKYEFTESDYESEKWKHSGSESDEPVYRPVKPPQTFLPQRKPVEIISPQPFPEVFSSEQKPKPKVSGYAADTEDTTYRKHESYSSVQETRQLFESKQSSTYQTMPSVQKFYKPPPQAPVFSQQKENLKSASVVKNISMTTKQVKSTEEPQLEQFPLIPDTKPKQPKVPPPPSPSKFIKGEFRESDYSSDYEEKMHTMWKSSETETEIKGYRPVKPNLTPTGRRSNLSEELISPIPPSEFEQPLKMERLPRPRFEPIKHEVPIKVHTQPHVYKPKPVAAKPVEVTKGSAPKQSYTTQYYTAIAGSPLHKPSVATETRNTMQMREVSETGQRFVNMSQTKRIIHFDQEKSSHRTSTESVNYAPSPATTISPHPYITTTPTPTKFIPGEFRESDYESEIENARIRPLWSPRPAESREPRYRHVNPPHPSRSTSLPRSYERVISPLEFDSFPPEISGRGPTSASDSFCRKKQMQSNEYYSSSKTYTTQTTKDDMNLKVGSPPKYGYISEKAHSQAKDFSSSIQKKASQFTKNMSTDLQTTHAFRPGFVRAPSEGDNKPQAYREESRVSQYGTKHVDPETGLIYFKYDFGYEFGIIFPGEGRKIIGGLRNNQLTNTPSKKYPFGKTTTDIIIPVQHERTTPKSFKQNGFTSESEFSETEYEAHAKKRFSLPVEINIDSFHKNDVNFAKTKAVAERSENVPVNAHLNREDRPKRPPMFITPLKDIAVVIGQTARFECIVQCDPHPKITWTKNGFSLQSSNKHIIEFRNGVCRLTIPEAYPDDAGTYSCTGTNELGSTTTTAELLVPANRCGVRY